jgi:hypothetical protein
LEIEFILIMFYSVIWNIFKTGKSNSLFLLFCNQTIELSGAFCSFVIPDFGSARFCEIGPPERHHGFAASEEPTALKTNE